ncbi:MAG: response regulator transcription factor [Panacagrimonas sp.]
MMERPSIKLDQIEKESALEPLNELGRILPSRTHDAASLTPRELQVIELLTHGWTNKRIARALGVSVHTVKFHLKASYLKFGASGRLEAVTMASALGLVRFPRHGDIEQR